MTKRLILTGLAVFALAVPSMAQRVNCIGQLAGSYRCDNVDLLSNLTTVELGGGACVALNGVCGSDMWGWTDPATGVEYAVVALSTGTVFVDLDDPENPAVIAILPTATQDSSWRDVKVYNDHAFVVSDNNGSHGMQVFDLTRLRAVVLPPEVVTADARYTGVGSAHNVVINEDTAYAYIVGGPRGATCAGGLHMVDISTPTSPSFVGCFAADGYTHDAQCVIYDGPDADYNGQEVCFNANEDTLTIVDVTAKAAPSMIARVGYSGYAYSHQGWLTEDHKYFLLDDEIDEINFGHNTRTYIWDVRNLDDPVMIGIYESPTENDTDHNQYIVGNFTYQANYGSGLRILDISDVANGNLLEVAYFDVFPDDDGSSLTEHDQDAGYHGAWSSYPFFKSGIVPVIAIEGGLFVLEPHLPDPPPPPVEFMTPCTEPLWADDFEDQTYTDWDGASDPDGDLSITGAAAMEGSWGLSVAVTDPSDSISRLLDNLDAGVDHYCFSFWFDPSNLNLPHARQIKIHGSKASNGVANIFTNIRYRNETGYQLGMKVRRDNGTLAKIGFKQLLSGPNKIEIEWKRADAPNNGILRLYINEVLVGALTGLNNDLYPLTKNAFGMMGLRSAGTFGELYFDGYESRTMP